MWTIKQPAKIVFGKHSARDYVYPKKNLIITSKGATKRGWLEYTNLKENYLFDQVEPNPSIHTVEKIISEFQDMDFDFVIGIGGGSSLDVAKFSAFKMNKPKIIIPTTFGSGSEVTRISVLKINGKKTSFHDDRIFADVAVVDSHFIEESDENIIKNSVIDACAQCTEAYNSKLSNPYTKFLCNAAFELLEEGILSHNFDKIVLGSLIDGLGFGNSSTTLGHALSYVYSNEGFSHGHALAFTTSVAHKFNKSKFYERFTHLVNFLKFEKISLNQKPSEAARLIMTDRKHLDNNPINVSESDIIELINEINKR